MTRTVTEPGVEGLMREMARKASEYLVRMLWSKPGADGERLWFSYQEEGTVASIEGRPVAMSHPSEILRRYGSSVTLPSAREAVAFMQWLQMSGEPEPYDLPEMYERYKSERNPVS